MMDNYHDIFYELDLFFEGDEWDHHKTTTDQISTNGDHQFCMNDTIEENAQKMIIHENCSEVEVSETDLKGKIKISTSKSTDAPLVENRTNPTRTHKRAAKPAQEPIRENLEEKKCTCKRINAKYFILPNGWTTEVRVRENGNSSGNKDTVKYYLISS
ncbi:hypothetical protein FXO37_32574 [Capsicum annuum]|nr:hypothetical protein FXO37_32574 [Capsicum annuum]